MTSTAQSTTGTRGMRVQAARRYVLLATATALAVSCIFSPSSPYPWCGPVSFLGQFGRYDLKAYSGLALLLLTLRGRIDYLLAGFFTLAGAFWAEGAERIHHVWHLPALLLWVEASPPLKDETIRASTIGLWHAHAALSKLQAHGLGWADGYSMSVWLQAFAWPWAKWASDLPIALLKASQAAALAIEAASPLAGFRQLRRWIGYLLVAFYFFVVVTFPFGFFLNGLIVYLYLIETTEIEVKTCPNTKSYPQ